MNDLREQLEVHATPDTVTAICRIVEDAIRATGNTRFPVDIPHDDERANHGRALGMMDAADLVKDARINHDPGNIPGVRVSGDGNVVGR